MQTLLDNAVGVLNNGGVIAYPTEFCFGLGCDPRNTKALKKLLDIKRRKVEQGVILIACELSQVEHYAEFEDLPKAAEIKASWPGPNTWLLPAKGNVSEWVRGKHSSVAMRIPKHDFCLALCDQFGHAIVSTSANRHGQAAMLSAQEVEKELGGELDYIVDSAVGGAAHASRIKDALSGETLR